MKKNIALLFLSIFTVSILSGCAKPNTTKTNTEVAKVKQTALSDTKTEEKKDEIKTEIKEEVKEDIKPVVPKETTVTEKKTVTQSTETPAVVKSNTAAVKQSAPVAVVKPITTPAPAPLVKPAPEPVVNKPSGLASINNEWRIWYRRLYATRYTGDKLAEFDALTLNVANGSISKSQAETILNNLGIWIESKTNAECFIYRVDVNVYTTSSNDVQTIVGDLNDRGLLTGDIYSNSYIYYDAAIKKNRVVMIGLNLPPSY